MTAMPADFVKKYRPVTIASRPDLKIYVNNYMSRDNPDATSNQLMNHCRSFFIKFAKKNSDVTISGGRSVSIDSLGIKDVHIPGSLKQPFIGKASPAQLATIIQVFDYWIGQDRDGDRSHYYRVSQHYPSVQTIADRCWGMDCNSFVGWYLKEYYPGHDWGPRVDVPGGAAPNEAPFALGGTLRNTAEAIRPRDVILYDHRHVSIVDEVIDQEKGQNWIVCDVAESKGKDAGGVQVNTREIVYKNGVFKISRINNNTYETLKCIVKPRGVPDAA